jgi:molybdate transport system substrate-binding protein
MMHAVAMLPLVLFRLLTVQVRRTLQLLSLIAVILMSACTSETNKPHAVTLTVSAAASLTGVFQEISARFTQTTGTRVTLNFGSSGQLAQQIAHGAPVDVYVSANMALVDDLERQGWLLPGTKQVYAHGRLVLWTPLDSPLHLTRLEEVARTDVRRIALANPTHAPYGVAAREALQTVGLWEQLQTKLVMGENVRQTLQYATTGNVDVALVALSLSQQHQGKQVVLPESLHRPIIHALAVVKQTQHAAEARRFVTYVTGPTGQALLQQYGFAVPKQDEHR